MPKIAKCQNIVNHRNAKMSAKCRIHKRQKTFRKIQFKRRQEWNS
jgi:hypothetical protein